MRIGSLCTGYGGLDHAVANHYNATVAWHAENAAAPSRVLAHHHPDTPNHGDFTSLDWSLVEPVDIITAGYPCQPFSTAGHRRGTNDHRHLWPAVARAISLLRPRHVVLENVAAHLTLGFDTVLADIARLGYNARWGVIRASDAGAPHQRARLFIVATTTNPRGGRLRRDAGEPPTQKAGPNASHEPPDNRGLRPDRNGRPASTDTDSDRRQQPPPINTRNSRLHGRHADRRSNDPDRRPDTHTRRHDNTAEEHTGNVDTPTNPEDNRRERPRPARRRRTRPQNSDPTPPNPNNDRRERLPQLDTPIPAQQPDEDGRHTDGRSNDPRRRPDTHPATPTNPESGRRRPRNKLETPNRPETQRSEEINRPRERDTAWGEYTAAIQHWETIIGRPAPPPTITNKHGRHQLNPQLSEWMMGLPPGHITSPQIGLTRAEQLRVCGNGVVPQAATLALRLLDPNPTHTTNNAQTPTPPRLLPTPRSTRGGSSTETMYALGGELSTDHRTQGELLLPTPQPVICNHCQNRPATKILAWRVHDPALVESGGDAIIVRSGAFCDECCELELADHHRDEPTVEAIS